MRKLVKLSIILLSFASAIFLVMFFITWKHDFAQYSLTCFLMMLCVVFGAVFSVDDKEEADYVNPVNLDLKDPKPVKTTFKKNLPKVPIRIDEGCQFDEKLPAVDNTKLMNGTDYWDEELIINNHF